MGRAASFVANEKQLAEKGGVHETVHCKKGKQRLAEVMPI